MERTITVRGRLNGPKCIDLDQAVNDVTGEVEVVVRAVDSATATAEQNVFDYLRALPAGTRSKEDIDAQIAAERAAWGDG